MESERTKRWAEKYSENWNTNTFIHRDDVNFFFHLHKRIIGNLDGYRWVFCATLTHTFHQPAHSHTFLNSNHSPTFYAMNFSIKIIFSIDHTSNGEKIGFRCLLRAKPPKMWTSINLANFTNRQPTFFGAKFTMWNLTCVRVWTQWMRCVLYEFFRRKVKPTKNAEILFNRRAFTV